MILLQVIKPSLFKKASNNGNNASRFRLTQELKDTYISESENESSRMINTSENSADPKTLYIKSRKTTFYLYRNPDDSDSDSDN